MTTRSRACCTANPDCPHVHRTLTDFPPVYIQHLLAIARRNTRNYYLRHEYKIRSNEHVVVPNR